MCILIVSKLNLKHQVFGLFSRFVRTLIIKISSSEEPVNSTSIHRVRNGGKLVVLFHPSPKSITERCRSLSWKPARARWKYQNGAKRRTNFLGPPPPPPQPLTQRQNECACSADFGLPRSRGFRGVICDSSVDDVCQLTNRTPFYTFWDWCWYDPTGKFFNGVYSYGKVWWVRRIIVEMVN